MPEIISSESFSSSSIEEQELEQQLKDLSASLQEADKVNALLLEKIKKLENRIEEINKNKINRIVKGAKKIRFMLATAGGKNNIFSKITFFFSPLGIKLIFKFFKKSFSFCQTKIKGNTVKEQEKDLYTTWTEKNFPQKKELQHFSEEQDLFLIKPLFSVIYAIASCEFPFNVKTLKALQEQIYKEWELVLVTNEHIYPQIKEAIKNSIGEEKVRVRIVRENVENAEMTNEGIKVAKGGYFFLLDHLDILSPDAFYHFAFRINTNPEADLIYSDEDHFLDGKFCKPLFKPDWCPDTIYSSNFIGKSVLFKRQILKQVGAFDKAYTSHFLFDAILKVSEVSTQLFHIDRVLLHKGTEDSPNTSEHYFQLKALKASIERKKIAAYVETIGLHSFRMRYKIKSYEKVSIIIPTKDKAEVLEKSLSSIFSKTSYPNYEVLVVDNNSKERKTRLLFDTYSKKFPSRFKVYQYAVPFNYSEINNFGVSKATGDYLVLLNNDTEVITDNWLECMVEQAQRKSIGAVGVKLLYPDRKIQHAGMVVGLEYGGNTFVGEEENASGYMNFINQVRNYSSVTAACLMCRREVYEEVGGLNENFAVEHNDVDFCLRLREAGYNNIYIPHVKLFHYESLSRGYAHLSKTALALHKKEAGQFRERWAKYIEHDPCYNKNLSKVKGGFCIE